MKKKISTSLLISLLEILFLLCCFWEKQTCTCNLIFFLHKRIEEKYENKLDYKMLFWKAH